MTPSLTLTAAVLKVQAHALTVDELLAALSRAERTGNPDRIGNALFDLQAALDEQNRLVGKALDETAAVTLPAFMATIPAAQPFEQVSQ